MADGNRAPIDYLTLKALLRWTYGSQLADVAVGHVYDASGVKASEPAAFRGIHPEDLRDGGYSVPSCLGSLMDLGGRVDGGRIDGSPTVIWADRFEVHPDALVVHRAVMSLPQLEAEMAIEFGRTGMFPEPAECIPRPGPKPIVSPLKPNERAGQFKGGGREFGYLLICHGVEKDVPIRRGKRGTIVGYRDIELLSCPLEYWPAPAWYEMVMAIDRRWREIETKLVARLGEMYLVEDAALPSGD